MGGGGREGEPPFMYQCPLSHIHQLAGKLVTERRKFQLGVCEVSGDCSPDSTLLSMLQQSKARGKAWSCPQTRLGMRPENYQLLCTLLCMSYSTC